MQRSVTLCPTVKPQERALCGDPQSLFCRRSDGVRSGKDLAQKASSHVAQRVIVEVAFLFCSVFIVC